MIDTGLKMCELDLAGDESMENVPKRKSFENKVKMSR